MSEENKNIIPYTEKPIEAFVPKEEERIRVYTEADGNKKAGIINRFLRYWRFLALTVAFVAIFLSLYLIFGGGGKSQGDVQTEAPDLDVPVAADPVESDSESTEEDPPSQNLPPLLLDESMTGIDILDEIGFDYSLASLAEASEGVKIIIIHSHASEHVSDSMTVLSAGDALSQILISGGLETYHCKTQHDSEGSIGAYDRMKESLTELTDKYNEAILVIDLHDSDSGRPLTFTVGTGIEYGWRENLQLACAVYGGMADVDGAFRLLPGILGQNNGLLTLHIGICGEGYSDEEARKVIASAATALLNICHIDDRAQ